MVELYEVVFERSGFPELHTVLVRAGSVDDAQKRVVRRYYVTGTPAVTVCGTRRRLFDAVILDEDYVPPRP